MRYMRRMCVLTLALAFVVSLVGCGQSTLQKVQKEPTKYKGQVVKVKGKVTRLLNYGKVACYTINDGKGEVIVKPKGTPPAKNKKVTITAKVEVDYKVGGVPLPLVLVEQ